MDGFFITMRDWKASNEVTSPANGQPVKWLVEQVILSAVCQILQTQ
jgi:hypothetical protein